MKAERVVGEDIGYRFLSLGLRLDVASIVGGAVNAIVVASLGSSANPWMISAGLRTLTLGLAAASDTANGEAGPKVLKVAGGECLVRLGRSSSPTPARQARCSPAS